MMRNNKRALALLVVSGALLMGVQEASAFSSYARTITSFCSSNGYDLLPEYEADTCDAACHKNASGQAAYDKGDYEYFCPAPVDNSPTCTDADGDGFYAEGDVCGTLADFNDNNEAAYPGAVEDCTDGVDNDGNGLIDSADPNAEGCSVACTDLDGDGYAIEGGACGAVDCNDADAAINPGALEMCTDAIDNNCNGLTDTADMNAIDCPLDCTDNDGDGYSIEGGSCGAMDCNDNDPEINPGALEVCGDGIDNNCNGLVDSLDGVCQTNGGNDNGGNNGGSDSHCHKPWWRSRDRHHHSHEKPYGGADSHADEPSEDAGDRNQEHSSNDGDRDRIHASQEWYGNPGWDRDSRFSKQGKRWRD